MTVSVRLNASTDTSKYNNQSVTSIDLSFEHVDESASMEELARIVIDWFSKQPRKAPTEDKK